MNWKVNYWTILFAVAGIGWLISSPIFRTERPKAKDDLVITQDTDSEIPKRYKIDNSLAIKRYQAFKRYASLFQDLGTGLTSSTSTDTLASKIRNMSISNPNVLYFHLPSDGISAFQNLLIDNSGSDLYALLSLKEDLLENAEMKTQDRTEVDLMFFVQNQGDDGDGDFYDFTSPCPTSCPDPPPSFN